MEPRIIVDYERIGAKVRSYRDRRALSLREASAEAGVSAPTLMRAERGGRIDLDTAFALARWIGVRLDKLVRATP